MRQDASSKDDASMKWPYVSIIVAVKNEERRITQCLSSLSILNYPGTYEVLLIDGLSTDATSRLIQEFCGKHPNFHYHQNPKQIASVGRNIGIQKSHGSIVAFTDGDIVVTQNWLRILVQSLVNGPPELAGVGGPNLTAPSATLIERSIRFATSTYWGSGRSIQYQHSPKKKLVNSISTCNAVYWKHILVEEGGFEERYYSGGELAFNLHLRKKGYHLAYIPEATVIHYQDESLKSFIQRMLYYGIVRTEIIKSHPNNHLPYIILILTGLLSLLLLPLYLRYIPLLFIVYMSFSWIASLSILKRVSNTIEVLLTPLFNLITHVVYFLGLLVGFLPSNLKVVIMEKFIDQ
jgi:cellulose synthase/poly-beta-1,6-N-acetylglucosamine synthase-like glycosyltransferase